VEQAEHTLLHGREQSAGQPGPRPGTTVTAAVVATGVLSLGPKSPPTTGHARSGWGLTVWLAYRPGDLAPRWVEVATAGIRLQSGR